MSRFLEIRNLLGLTQQEMSEVLGCVQSNVSFLDRGQTITPDVARKLIEAGHAMQVELSFECIYGNAPLPARPTQRPEPRRQNWPELISELRERGWTLMQIAARIGCRVSHLRALETDDQADASHALGSALLKLHSSCAQPTQAQGA